MTTLFDLPAEILSQILAPLAYTDLLGFSKTCREAHSFVSPQNQLLWQAIFCRMFDDPRDRWNSLTETARAKTEERERNWDWFLELKRRVVALRWVQSDDNDAVLLWDEDEDEIEALVDTFLDILDTAKTCPTPQELKAGKEPKCDDRDLSLNLALLPSGYYFTGKFDGLVRGVPVSAGRGGYGSVDAAVMNMPGAWNRTPGRPLTRSQAAREMDKLVRSEAGSRLHVLCGLTGREKDDIKAVGRARRITYDWDLTNAGNEYGPFKDDGSGEVDWRRLECISTVVTRQFSSDVRDRWILPSTRGFCYYLPYRTLTDPTTPEDWARASGNWWGTYVFLIWEDLASFNLIPSHADRPSLEYGHEASGGLMKLNLHLDMSLRDDPRLQTRLPICRDLPPLYFCGTSTNHDLQMATEFRGMACLVLGGREVRWRFIVHRGGEDQWQLEGVQPGGVRSGCVIGMWTSCAREEGGPVGPFFYAPEELCKMVPVPMVPYV